MIVWSTQIPILPTKTVRDLETLCTKWITGSPHSNWKLEEVPKAVEGGVMLELKHDQKISVAHITHDNEEYFGFLHEWRDSENRDWTTEIVSFHNKTSFLVAVHLRCQTAGVGVRIKNPKKPYVVRQIVDELGGDVDGAFQVMDKPRVLAENEIDLAKRIIAGESRHYLPVIYVSSTWNNSPALNPLRLAQWSGGMAHVVVEPSRAFSFNLARKVNRQNPYEGSVAIYWPSGGGTPTKLHPYNFRDESRFASAVADVVRKALAGRRPDPRVTWSYIRELILRDKIESMRSKGAEDLDEYIEAFDEEVKLVKSRAEALENENGQLKRRLANFEHMKSYYQSSEDGVIAEPEEQELFPGEFSDVLVQAIKRYRDSSHPDGRVRDVLTSFIECNKETGKASHIENEIREILDSCDEMTSKERKALENIGFTITEDGKHYKLTFRGDDRYTFSMAKTGSDWRGMKNWVSDTTKRLFK
ncbi:hypothetical protein P0Y35_08605 [Kiritimatiellaeota bacterium B1221]|nr:hypothetical protein [Kiritimatiellaeota bacterium B1221]